MSTKTQGVVTPLSKFIALHLFTTPPKDLAALGETQGKLLSEAREKLDDPLIKQQNIAELVRDWAARGWVELTHNYVRMTQAGEPELLRIAS